MQINLINKIQPAANLAHFGHKREHQYICHECQRPKSFTARLGHPPLIRCITPGCAQTSFKPIDPSVTTWTACKFI
jgi:hypothetical protein